MQIDPIIPTLKPPGTTRLKLGYDQPPSNFAFKFNWRRYIESTLKFHPDACLIIYSPTLTLDYFQPFWDLGYNIIVERPDVPYLIRGRNLYRTLVPFYGST